MKVKFTTSLLATLLVCCVLTGCRSFSSTPVSRTESDSFHGDSNGVARYFRGGARPFKGTPVKLKVQTHTDVFVEETYELRRSGGTWLRNDLGKKFYQVRTEPVFGEQIVFVDFKRPASGSLDMDITYSADQYLKAINSSVTDTTIADTAGLVTEAIKFMKPAETGKDPDSSAPEIERDATRVVAYKRFDINAVDYEIQLEQFVNQYLNNCDSCGVAPSYDTGVINHVADPVYSGLPLESDTAPDAFDLQPGGSLENGSSVIVRDPNGMQLNYEQSR